MPGKCKGTHRKSKGEKMVDRYEKLVKQWAIYLHDQPDHFVRNERIPKKMQKVLSDMIFLGSEISVIIDRKEK